MRFRIRLGRFVLWSVLLVVVVLAGGLGYAYFHYTDSRTLAALIRSEAPRYLPGCRTEVSQVRLRALAGEVVLHNLTLNQTVDGTPLQTVRVPWLSIRHDARALFKGQFVPREVVVAQPTLRLMRRKDGTWNLQGLLADPWPGPTLKGTPPVSIQNGTVELAEADDQGRLTSVAILRDVLVKVNEGEGTLLRFEGSAKGDLFDRVRLGGTVDRVTGRVTLQGDLARLAISETFRKRLPAEARPAVEKLGLNGGELDLDLENVVYDPKATPRLSYAVAGRLRSGLWACEKLPFPINDLHATFAIRDGVLTVDRAEGVNGSTTVRVQGRLALGDPARAPLNVHVELIDLELNDRLRKWTPREFAGLWDEFQPRGRVRAHIDAARERPGGPVAASARVDCVDVGLLYRHFKYPLDHVYGRVTWNPRRVTVDLRTLVGGKPLVVSGTIDEPGPRAVVTLDFQAEEMPIDKALLGAMPPEVRKVIDDFTPTGSVRGTAHLARTPPRTPQSDPKGQVTFDAVLDLSERCSMRWKGLPYPVENLTGRLEVHPDQWIFTNMRGGNGQAVLTGSGKVEKVGRDAQGRDQLKVDLHLAGTNLPFDEELRRSLPPAWQKTWETLKPRGASDLDARIKVEPGKDDYHLVITPRAATGIRLAFTRAPKPGSDPGGHFELAMDDVSGRFVFDNGTVSMQDIGFLFHGAKVQFPRGTVVVENSGSFKLIVRELRANGLRLDSRLQAIMPPVTAQFARRLDDGKPFTVKGDLGLQWSGRPEQPVFCEWDKVQVFFIDNSIQAGIPLEHLQGQLESVRGWSDGDGLEVHGALRLESVILLGQQVTRLESPFHVEKGAARLDEIRGGLLGGEVSGQFRVSLDATPNYAATLIVRDADLQRYARSLPGRQSFRGLVAARLDFNGRGNDLHSLQGDGEAHISQGDLGELPGFLRLVKILNLSPATKTAFDSADLAIKIRDGESYLDPIKFTGDAFSLVGKGVLDIRGELDLRLRALYGRDRLHLLLLSDALREASGQIFVVHVRGTPAYPKFSLEPLPKVTDLGKSLIQRRAANRTGRPGP